jgi:hypothetical protein
LHIDVAGLMQALLVLHVEAGWSVLVVQVAAAHWVPDGYFWQAPLPLQRPFVPQVDEPWSVHWVVGFGGCPPVIEVQVPTVPDSAHELQVVLQALLQQTPCAQNPELHIAAAEQGDPIDSFPQVPTVWPDGMVQEAGEVQSVASVQLVLQAALVPQA